MKTSFPDKNINKTGTQAYQELKFYLKEGLSFQNAASACCQGLALSSVTTDKKIVAIVPVPQNQSLMIYKSSVRLIASTVKACVSEMLYLQMGFRHWDCYRETFISLMGCTHYKTPCATDSFTLFPLDSVDDGVWLNILKIIDIHYENKCGQILIGHDLIIYTFTSKRSLTHQLTQAYRFAALLNPRFQNKLDYTQTYFLANSLQVPINDFNKKIFNSLDLKSLRLPRWQFWHTYQDHECSKRSLTD